jgi:PAS domain S-box-containing protein
MNKKRSAIPTILVLYENQPGKEPEAPEFEALRAIPMFASFSEFMNYRNFPEYTVAVLFLDFPQTQIIAHLNSISPNFNCLVALYRDNQDLKNYLGIGISRTVDFHDSNQSIIEKINLFIEIFQQELEIRDLSEFIEVSHLKNREQNTKIKLLSSTVKEPILIVNQDKKITLWNKEAHNVFGYSKFEVIQENFFQLIISQKSLELIEKIFSDVLSGNIKNLKTNHNIIVRNKLGIEFETLASISTHRSRAKGHNFVFVLHDIQKAKKLEREMIKSRELWEETKILKEFVHHVTHELRTPMNSIIGIAKAIEKYNSENLSARQKEGLDIIINSGNQLVALIKDLLDIARMDKNKIELNNEVFDLNKLLSLLKSQALQLIDDKPVKFLTKKSPTVPNSLFGDHRKIVQILTNLVGNAVKFTNEGKIVLSCHYFEEKLFFEVADTGIGIRPEKQKEIFQKFTQADVTFNSIGTGLGLHISKKLTELLNGEISIESEFKKGTIVRFYVTLPATPEEINKAKSLEHRDIIKVISNKPHQKLILAIDDTTQNSFVYRLLADNNNFNVVQICNGKSGIRAMRFFHPDLIILKIEIPELHGSSIIKEIRAHNPDTVVISLSEIQPVYNLPGVRFCLQDPINYDSILQTISEIKQWPKRKSIDTMVIYDKRSWIEEFTKGSPEYQYIKNQNPEHALIKINQFKIRQLVIEDLSNSSNALNLALRLLSEENSLEMKIVLHNEGAPLKLIKDKIKTQGQILMLNMEEIQNLLSKKSVIEE